MLYHSDRDVKCAVPYPYDSTRIQADSLQFYRVMAMPTVWVRRKEIPRCRRKFLRGYGQWFYTADRTRDEDIRREHNRHFFKHSRLLNIEKDGCVTWKGWHGYQIVQASGSDGHKPKGERLSGNQGLHWSWPWPWPEQVILPKT